MILFLICGSTTHIHSNTPFHVDLSSQTLDLGDILTLTIQTKQPIDQSTITFLNKSFGLFVHPKKPNTYISYIVGSRKKQRGTYPLSIRITQNNQDSQLSFPITLNHDPASEGTLKFKGKKKTLSKRSDQLMKEIREIARVLKTTTPTLYITEKFIIPTKGPYSSFFGSIRSYSNGQKGKSHSGVDIKNKPGTPIFSSNMGKVALSKSYPVHGETIIIDHGWGIYSIYLHLQKRSVSKGDMVSPDTFIGTMGQTGLATGPHLHWGLSIQNVRANPLFWVENTPL